MKRIMMSAAAAGIAVAMATNARAEDPMTVYVPQGEVGKGARDGVDGTLGVAANVSLTGNDSVVGQTDGFSFLFGFALTGGLDYVAGSHEIRNTLSITEAWAQTPALDEMVKTNDVVGLESLYNFFFADSAGAFGRLSLQTNILETEDIRAEKKNFLITKGVESRELNGVDRVPLTSSFEPLTLAESAGLFWQPIRDEAINAAVRLGIGGRETLADGALVVTDIGGTEQIELTELANVFQGGAEAFVGVDGKLSEGRVGYRLGFDALLPVINNDPQERSSVDLLRLGLVGAVSFSVFEWMSLNYQLKVLSDPQLLDQAQIQNNLMLTLNYTLIKRNEPPPPPPPVNPEVEAALKKAEEAAQQAKAAEESAKAAEERAKAAEERAKAAEERAKTVEQPQ
ncbi:MAG: hypothetical protein HY791_11055 [Deltaproteobacteria bacterium]|nr:hypothetical protein [Deltaproteobacteria bacterium]